MFNLIKMNLYRMSRAVSTWVMAIVAVLFGILQFSSLKLMQDDPLNMFSNGSGTDMLGYTILNGVRTVAAFLQNSNVLIILAIFVVMFTNAEHKCGFDKNIIGITKHKWKQTLARWISAVIGMTCIIAIGYATMLGLSALFINNFAFGSVAAMFKALGLMYLSAVTFSAIFFFFTTLFNNSVGGVVASGGAFATLVTPQDYQMHFVTASESGLPYVSMYITNEFGDAPVLADIRGYGYLMNMITTSCEHPDKVIKLFDFLTSKEGQLLVTLGIEGVTWNYTDETETEVVFTQTYLDEKAADTSTKYGLMQFDVLINYQLYDNMQPRTNNGKTPQELLRTNLKRPLTIYAYDYNAMHFVVDTTDARYPEYAQSMAKIESLIGKQLPKIIQAANREKAIEVYNKTVETMVSYGLALVKEMNASAYQKTKEKLGITVAWPPYQDGYDVKPDRLNPNGDSSYYRSY